MNEMKSDVKKNLKAEKTLKLRDLIAPKCDNAAVNSVVDDSRVEQGSSALVHGLEPPKGFNVECRMLPSQGPVQGELGVGKENTGIASTNNSENMVAAKSYCSNLSLAEKINVLWQQNAILARVMAAPRYRALAEKIFRTATVFHIGEVEQLFRGKGYGEDWLTVVTSALASETKGEETIVSFDARFDAEVQRAVVDFPDMERPLGVQGRVIYDIFVLYKELKQFC